MNRWKAEVNGPGRDAEFCIEIKRLLSTQSGSCMLREADFQERCKSPGRKKCSFLMVRWIDVRGGVLDLICIGSRIHCNASSYDIAVNHNHRYSL